MCGKRGKMCAFVKTEGAGVVTKKTGGRDGTNSTAPQKGFWIKKEKGFAILLSKSSNSSVFSMLGVEE